MQFNGKSISRENNSLALVIVKSSFMGSSVYRKVQNEEQGSYYTLQYESNVKLIAALLFILFSRLIWEEIAHGLKRVEPIDAAVIIFET